MKIKIRYILAILILLILIISVFDYMRISNYEVHPMLPKKKTSNILTRLYYDIVKGKKNLDWNQLTKSLDYIDAQYDVADFRFAPLMRILYDYPDVIPDSLMTRVKNSILKFRYWMDEPGENSMCYWSENHQILFASAEYLAGQLYPDEIFLNDGLTGRQHKDKAEKRINDWLEMRWKYGFTEFYSNVYYSEDIAGMINLIDYADNDTISKKTIIIMDLLMYDIASQSLDNMFVSTSGRAYERSRKGGAHAVLGGLTEYYWESLPYPGGHMTFGMTTSKKYEIPPVLIEIGNDKNNVVIKQSNGLNISELQPEGYYGTDNRSIMMQWGMEAFTNSEIIRNTMSYVRENRMFTNEFVNPISILDFTILDILHLEPIISSILKPPTDGVSIQKSNTYTYKTEDYSLYTVQNYLPGFYANQNHISGMNIGNSFGIFHTHPASPIEKRTPSYWIGYGRLPHAVQDSSVSLAIYNLPEDKALLEKNLFHFTHAYFPTEKFDTIKIVNNYAFGKKENTYCAFIGKNNFTLKQNTTDDLLQEGRQTFWITEAGSQNKDGSFDNFCNRILQNKFTFDTTNAVLNYFSNDKKYKLKYNSDFSINGNVIDTDYDRYNSPYIKAKRKAKTFDFKLKNKFLHLDFDQLERNYN
ncbi:MAG: hypothetical protein PVH88_14700 [Ignavibacteria bacterium]|jgi:hypothetical protein